VYVCVWRRGNVDYLYPDLLYLRGLAGLHDTMSGGVMGLKRV
jgi:hypothetical protein